MKISASCSLCTHTLQTNSRDTLKKPPRALWFSIGSKFTHFPSQIQIKTMNGTGAPCAQTRAQLIPSRAAHLGRELLQAQYGKSTRGLGRSLGLRGTAEPEGAHQIMRHFHSFLALSQKGLNEPRGRTSPANPPGIGTTTEARGDKGPHPAHTTLPARRPTSREPGSSACRPSHRGGTPQRRTTATPAATGRNSKSCHRSTQKRGQRS